MKVFRLKKNSSPFSFLNLIFINNGNYSEIELLKIISHEKVHIKQKHSIDLILFELLLIFQWFNPFVWFYKRAIKMTHEYLADVGTINSGIDLPDYQCSLLNQILHENNVEMASNYNLSVKKRIEMMMKKRSSKLSALKLTVALPIFIFLISAFAFKIDPSKKVANDAETSPLLTNGDTTTRKVNVSIDYLKLLEGEYVSTNQPNSVRRILFSEALGTLFGTDDGYTYRLISVGDGKFINPDDGASLIFDTKDKSAISLLLFGKITLNKVKIVKGSGNLINRSLAFTLVKVMAKDGIAAGLSYYKLAKDSSNYLFTENEMNLAGYELLQLGKVKEAASLFKLNTELVPTSFNTYDSYAEALLLLGDKPKAIENYKKSLQLNPGSKSGLQKLKELGVNTDDVIKPVKVSNDYLKNIEGTYLSTNQPTWVRMIKFVTEEGVLVGNDNGYKYKLIPMGDGKFINPDDGASLVFDTKDKNGINLLLFGTINLKKAKTPNTNSAKMELEKYAGVYYPSKKDTILSSMEIIKSNNKLYRFIDKDPMPANRMVELELVTDNTFFYTDNSHRSIEFIVDDNKEVSGCIVRRADGIFKLSKQK
jgi:tetratricopeptide (TPR) repeat protein